MGFHVAEFQPGHHLEVTEVLLARDIGPTNGGQVFHQHEGLLRAEQTVEFLVQKVARFFGNGHGGSRLGGLDGAPDGAVEPSRVRPKTSDVEWTLAKGFHNH